MAACAILFSSLLAGKAVTPNFACLRAGMGLDSNSDEHRGHDDTAQQLDVAPTSSDVSGALLRVLQAVLGSNFPRKPFSSRTLSWNELMALDHCGA